MQKRMLKSMFNSLRAAADKDRVSSSFRFIHGTSEYWEATEGHILVRMNCSDEADNMSKDDHIFVGVDERFRDDESFMDVINTKKYVVSSFTERNSKYGERTRRVSYGLPDVKLPVGQTGKFLYDYPDNHIPDFILGVPVLKRLVKMAEAVGALTIQFTEEVVSLRDNGVKGRYCFHIRISDHNKINAVDSILGMVMPINFSCFEHEASERKKAGQPIHGIQQKPEKGKGGWFWRTKKGDNE